MRFLIASVLLVLPGSFAMLCCGKPAGPTKITSTDTPADEHYQWAGWDIDGNWISQAGTIDALVRESLDQEREIKGLRQQVSIYEAALMEAGAKVIDVQRRPEK